MSLLSLGTSTSHDRELHQATESIFLLLDLAHPLKLLTIEKLIFNTVLAS